MPDPAPPAALDVDLAALRDAGTPVGEHREPGPATVRVRDLRPGPDGPPVPVRLYEGTRSDLTLVHAHGGGWSGGDLDAADELSRHLAAHAGCRVVSVDYRLAPAHPFPTGLDDLDATYAWTRRSHGGPVGLCGEGAGGNLAAALVHRLLSRAAPAPALLVLVHPALGLPGRTRSYVEHAQGFPLGAHDMLRRLADYAPPPGERSTDLAPLHAEQLTGHPRTHLVLAGHDPLHDEGAAYAHLLASNGVPVTVVDHPTLCHGFLQLTAAAAAAAAARDQLVRDVGRLARRTTPVPVQIGATRRWPIPPEPDIDAYHSATPAGDSASGETSGNPS